MRKLFLLLLFGLGTKHIAAQEYISEGKNRLNFAKTYFELGGQFSPSFTGKRVLTNNTVQSFENSASIVPYLNIGGLHFWGHADFYISIPLRQLNFKKNDSTDFQFNQSVVTGARFLPWAYKDNKIRPFIGASWAVVNFKQEIKPNNNQPLFSKNKLLFDAGLLYGKGNFMARLAVNFYPDNKWEYPVTETNFQQIQTPNWNAYFGLVYAFESTRSKNMETENAKLNEFPKVSSPSMNATKKGDFFIGIGPSTSFMLANSDYNESKFPYFNKKAISNTYFDISFGYQFNKLGLVAALSFRNPKFTNEAYGTTQIIKKNSFVLETYKYLTDYSGFTPYIGLNLAYDYINYSEKNNATNLSTTYKKITPGITFGWDILPGKTEQWFVLRTNLRWFPFENINIEGKEFSLNQIEYNVIQAVFYPSRFKNVKSKKDK
jgi:outer membrane protein W